MLSVGRPSTVRCRREHACFRILTHASVSYSRYSRTKRTLPGIIKCVGALSFAKRGRARTKVQMRKSRANVAPCQKYPPCELAKSRTALPRAACDKSIGKKGAQPVKPRFSREISDNLRPNYDSKEPEFLSFRQRASTAYCQSGALVYPAFVFGVSVMLGLLCLTKNAFSERLRQAKDTLFLGHAIGSRTEVTLASGRPAPSQDSGVASTTIDATLQQNLAYWQQISGNYRELENAIAQTTRSVEPNEARLRGKAYRTAAEKIHSLPSQGIDARLVKLCTAFQLWLHAAAALDEDLAARLLGQVEGDGAGPHTGNWVEDQSKLAKRLEAWLHTSGQIRTALSTEFAARWPQMGHKD